MAHVWLCAATMTPNIPKTHSLREPPLSDSAPSASSPRVLLSYENLESGMRAMDMFRSICRQAGAELENQVSLWRFDLFECHELRDAAAVQAERADIIILSLQRHDDLPRHVRTWLETGLKRRSLSEGALVAAFDSVTSAKSDQLPVATYLQGLATAAGMDFFCGELAQSARGCNFGMAASIAAAQATFDAPTKIPQAVAQWGSQRGINQ